ncbi:hypothetical protein BOMU111920_20570 [Bordetella muralis]
MKRPYPASHPTGRLPRLSIKRLLAVLLLLMGGLSVEAVKPVQCSLIANSRNYRPRAPSSK